MVLLTQFTLYWKVIF